MIIVLSGPGGVGKGVIASRLVDTDRRLWLSRSWTTRSQRPGEPDDAYVFVDTECFESAIASGALLEWDHHFGNYYGTPLPEVRPECDVLLEIDVNGAEQVAGKVESPLLLFIDAPSRDDQRRRLEGRGDDADLIVERLTAADRERAKADELGFVVVVNDDVDRAVAEILSLIEARRAAR